jgi:hypothetical protein
MGRIDTREWTVLHARLRDHEVEVSRNYRPQAAS